MRPLLQLIHDRRFWKFGVVGVSNTLISYLVFIALLELLRGFAWRGALAQCVGYGVATLWSYYWNRRWSFGSSGPVRREMTRFVVTQAGCLLLSGALIGLLVDVMGLPPTPSWVLVTAAIVVVNFMTLRVWVFQAAGDGPR